MFKGLDQDHMARIEECLNMNYEFPSRLLCIPEINHSKRVYKTILMDPYVCPFVNLNEETKNITLKSLLSKMKNVFSLRKES